jgi:diadenosine tetraphosphate (Ap4A) HIT family hydrolase
MCPLCEREALLRAGSYPYLVKELEHTWWLLGEHQYYAGYSVLLLKGHEREISDLSPERAEGVFRELRQVESAVRRTFRPHKMNLCSLGNVVDHVHWHLFPRYAEDSQRANPAWLQMGEFATKNITPNEAQPLIQRLTQSLANDGEALR